MFDCQVDVCFGFLEVPQIQIASGSSPVQLDTAWLPGDSGIEGDKRLLCAVLPSK